MLDKPLQPFSPPSSLANFMPGGISLGLMSTILFLGVFIIWALYTAVAIYHWFKYSNASWVTVPAIITHLAVSFVLMTYAISGAFI